MIFTWLSSKATREEAGEEEEEEEEEREEGEGEGEGEGEEEEGEGVKKPVVQARELEPREKEVEEVRVEREVVTENLRLLVETVRAFQVSNNNWIPSPRKCESFGEKWQLYCRA